MGLFSVRKTTSETSISNPSARLPFTSLLSFNLLTAFPSFICFFLSMFCQISSNAFSYLGFLCSQVAMLAKRRQKHSTSDSRVCVFCLPCFAKLSPFLWLAHSSQVAMLAGNKRNNPPVPTPASDFRSPRVFLSALTLPPGVVPVRPLHPSHGILSGEEKEIPQEGTSPLAPGAGRTQKTITT